MKKTNHSISINVLTDNHLESFVRCPYKFKHQYILRKNGGEEIWRQMVSFAVHRIINDYYHLPEKERNDYHLLRLIDKYWKPIQPRIFHNQIHYYTTAAKLTDYLLQFLLANQNNQPPLFLYERMETFVEEIGIQLSINLNIGEWSQHSFTVKKYLLEADERIIQLYKYLTPVFSKKAFGVIPDQIQLFSLLDGDVHFLYPKEHDVAKGLIYLQHMKRNIENLDQYIIKKEAMSKEKISNDMRQETVLHPSVKMVMH